MALLPNPLLKLPKFVRSFSIDPTGRMDAYALSCDEYIPYDELVLKIFP